MSYPSQKYLTIISGEIWGPIRYEALDGSEYFDEKNIACRFHNFTTFEKDGKMWEISIIQKKSPKGWLNTSPFGYYWWNQSKLQEQKIVDEGNGPFLKWITGTERGLYFRCPFTWRRDIAGTMIDGQLRNWVHSGGHLGRRFD